MSNYRPPVIYDFNNQPAQSNAGQVMQGLVDWFAQMWHQSKLDKKYEDDIKRKERYYDEQLEDNKQALKESNWLKINIAMRTDLHNIYQNKVTEFNTEAAKYEALAGKGDAITDLNQTDAYVELLGTTASDALSEVSNDIQGFQQLILDADNRSREIVERITIMSGISHELVNNSGKYNINPETGLPATATDLEKDMGVNLWTAQELGLAVENIVSDRTFREKHGLTPISDDQPLHNPDWLNMFVDRLSNPTDATLNEMNRDVFEYYVTKADAHSKALGLRLQKIQTDLASDPLFAYSAQLSEPMKNMQQLDKAFEVIPGFAALKVKESALYVDYAKSISDQSVVVWDLMNKPNEENWNIVKGLLQQEGIYSPKIHPNPTSFEMIEMYKYHKKRQLSDRSVLAAWVGPHKWESALSLGTNAGIATIFEEATHKFEIFYKGQLKDGYRDPNSQDPDVVAAHQVLLQLVSNLGEELDFKMPTDTKDASKSKLKFLLSNDPKALAITNRIQVLQGGLGQMLQSVIGKGGDSSDNELFRGLKMLQDIENKIKESFSLGPKEYGNLSTVNPDAQLFNFEPYYNEEILNDLSECTLSGGSWLEGFGCNFVQLKPTDKTSIIGGAIMPGQIMGNY